MINICLQSGYFNLRYHGVYIHHWVQLLHILLCFLCAFNGCIFIPVRNKASLSASWAKTIAVSHQYRKALDYPLYLVGMKSRYTLKILNNCTSLICCHFKVMWVFFVLVWNDVALDNMRFQFQIQIVGGIFGID